MKHLTIIILFLLSLNLLAANRSEDYIFNACDYLEYGSESILIDGVCEEELGIYKQTEDEVFMDAWLAGGDCLVHLSMDKESLQVNEVWTECAE